MVSKINFSNPIYCVITGASRGIGRTIAVQIATLAVNRITLVLLARTLKGLEETKKLIGGVNKNAHVINVIVDLSQPNNEKFKDIIKEIPKEDNTSAVIFHNAGQLGRLDKITNISDVTIWQEYFNLNVFAVTSLNSIFISEVSKLTKNITVVNITSLFGRQAGKYVGLYGTAKAARDMYFKVFAEEEPEYTVLNWSPGMVKTDMALDLLTQMDDIERKQEKDEVIKRVLNPEQTVGKMLMVLDENQFKSGDIVDYYDF